MRKSTYPTSISPDIYEGFKNISKDKASGYDVWVLDKGSDVFQDPEYMRVILQKYQGVKDMNQLQEMEDIYMAMYRSKIYEFMTAHKVNNIWWDLCRGLVGNIPSWITTHIFSQDPFGQEESPMTLFTHDYVFYVDSHSQELKGVLIYKWEELALNESYEELQIKLLCTSQYTDRLGSRIMRSLRMFRKDPQKKLYARIIDPTRNAKPFYTKLGFKSRSDGTMTRPIASSASAHHKRGSVKKSKRKKSSKSKRKSKRTRIR